MAINVSQPFHRTSAGPIDDSLNLSKAQMLTVNDNLMPSKWFTVCADDGQFYLYDKSNESDEETGKFRLYQSGKTYSSGDGIDVDNENNEISVDEMPAEDMGEIVTPLPGIKPSGIIYSTTEQKIGKWIDGSDLYQITITGTLPSSGNETYPSNRVNEEYELGVIIGKLVNVFGIVKLTNNTSMMIPDAVTADQWVVVWVRNNDHATKANTAGIAVGTNAALLSQPFTLTVQYTKTT